MKKEEKELTKLIKYIYVQEKYISTKMHSIWVKSVNNKTEDIFYPVSFWDIAKNMSERSEITDRYINYWKGIEQTKKANEFLDYIEGKQKIKIIRKYNLSSDTKLIILLNKIDVIISNNKITHLSLFGKKLI